MPSVLSTILRAQISLLNPLLQSLDLEEQRRLQDGLAEKGARARSSRICIKDGDAGDFQYSWCFPCKGRVDQAILYLHGGAYVAGTLQYAKGFGGLLSQLSGRAVLCCAYRLAPEDPFPAALQDALAAYQLMLERYDPAKIAFVGESAGGGLCFSLALKLKEEGLPLPRHILTLSPWTDLSMERPLDDLAGLDPVLRRESLLQFARMYAGDRDLREPAISPINGDLTGLPETMILVGSHEILLDDACIMADRIRLSGGKCQLHIEPGMWHVYPLYPVPEARKAHKMMKKFLMSSTKDINL